MKWDAWDLFDDGRVWLVVIIFMTILVSSLATHCSMNKDKLITEMVLSGVSPIEAKCAVMSLDESDAWFCYVATKDD